MKETKTSCQKVVITKKGEKILQNKKKYQSELAAKSACKNINLKPNVKEMCSAYYCSVCGQWHVGRNGRKMTDGAKQKLIDNYFKIKVVGFIDLDKNNKT